MPGWQDEQQSQRRFSKRGRKDAGHGKNGSHGETFQPRNMLGRYTLKSNPIEKLNTSLRNSNEQELWLEIHGLVESATGYYATFDLGVVSGAMLIAGSRKVLRNVVEDADSTDEEEEEESDSPADASGEGEDQSSDSGVGSSDETRDAFISAPELDRPDHAFEKNTFRTPKWFAQWRGEFAAKAEAGQARHAAQDDVGQPDANGLPATPDHATPEDANKDQTHPDNKAHFEFSSAACRDFNATFSCPALDIREAAVQGWKVTNKATPATIHWRDYAS